MKPSYSNLLLKLATDEHHPIPFSAFSTKHFCLRILLFLLLPMAAFLLMSFTIKQEAIIVPSANQLKVGTISWTGNTIYTDSQLNDKLGIKRGDPYNTDLLNQRLWGLDSTYSEDALSSLYLDNGYLFFNVEFKEGPQEKGYIDLTFNIFEGVQAYINEITIEGNGLVPERKILKRITIKKGDLFSKTKLINSVWPIAEMRQFDSDKIELTKVEERIIQQLWKLKKAFGKTYEYSAAISKADYRKTRVKKIISTYFGDSPATLVSHIVKEESLSKEEMRQLKKLIKKMQ